MRSNNRENISDKKIAGRMLIINSKSKGMIEKAKKTPHGDDIRDKNLKRPMLLILC